MESPLLRLGQSARSLLLSSPVQIRELSYRWVRADTAALYF
ncbi:MAG TPA: hypothetical protein V6D11_00785 [Waterburya sp.]